MAEMRYPQFSIYDHLDMALVGDATLNKPETNIHFPSSFVAKRWKWFVLFFAANSLIMALAFRHLPINGPECWKWFEFFASYIFKFLFYSAIKSIKYCSYDILCFNNISFFCVFMIYMLMAILILSVIFSAAFIIKTGINAQNDKPITIMITAIVAFLNFFVTNYASKKVFVFGINITKVDENGHFILWDCLILTLTSFSAIITLLNIIVAVRHIMYRQKGNANG